MPIQISGCVGQHKLYNDSMPSVVFCQTDCTEQNDMKKQRMEKHDESE